MKKWMVIALLVCALLLAGCGNSEKVIEGTPDVSGAADTETDDGQENAEQETGGGYVLVVQETVVQIDADISTVTETLGEPLSYYEAASCAFDGLDKIYTYSGFTVQTYPDSDGIYMIVLKDDSVSTQEGVSIGDSIEQVEAAYGTEYTESTGEIIYYKDGMKLSFILQEEQVISITYSSTAYDGEA